jgi:hypothetical protein
MDTRFVSKIFPPTRMDTELSGKGFVTSPFFKNKNGTPFKEKNPGPIFKIGNVILSVEKV